MLNKIKSIAAGAVLAAAVGGGTYLTTDVNYVEAFGPGAGMTAAAAVGWLVPESIATLKRYLGDR